MRGVNATDGRPIEGEAHLRQSVLDVLGTPLGSRVLRREYGSRLMQLLSAPVNRGYPARVKAAALDALTRWEPRVRFHRMDLRVPEPGRVVFDLYGAWREDGRPVQLSGLELGASA